MSIRQITAIVLVAFAVVTSPVVTVACPFCSAVGQTLRQEMALMDAVVIATSIEGDSARNLETGEVRMRIERVLKGGDLVKQGQEVNAIYYGEVAVGRRFMLSGVDPPDMQWSCLPLSERAEAYVVKIPTLGEDDSERLKFYYDYLQDDEAMLSRDAYDEFAIAPYASLKALKPQIDHPKLVEWIGNPETSVDRKRLYLTMLGVVGDQQDLPFLEQMLRSSQKSTRSGLDALIGCYLTLAGEKGLADVDELFLENKKASYADTYAAIMAIRFHGTEGDVIPRSALVESLHHVLDRKDLADLVIPDLSRWSDWSQIEKMRELFLQADPDNNWVRVPVVNYLRACPRPEAAKLLEELEKVDPDSIKRANSFFSIPVPAQDTSESETSIQRKTDRKTVQRSENESKKPAAMLTRVGPPAQKGPLAPNGTVGTGIAAPDPVGFGERKAAGLGPMAATPNPWRLAYVVSLALSTIMIGQFLLLSGGPQASGL
ncbi:hypothetical protein Poly41_10030 [Novipirellula artificiosorum]|uniref:Uncharacterized protein n=2 Tax=Novipirellula artificiosorum TaxID=2528016 RepID=A0A5C6DZ35_9BACT|nr:hypothetical protein Poly41_10030 [Novipirellula artificiosorum]